MQEQNIEILPMSFFTNPLQELPYLLEHLSENSKNYGELSALKEKPYKYRDHEKYKSISYMEEDYYIGKPLNNS